MRRNNMEVENFKIDNRTYNILSCGRGSNKMSYNLLLQLFDILDSFDSEKQLREFIEMLKMSLYDWQIKILFKIIREKQDVQLYGPGLGKTLLFNSLVGNGYPGRIYVDNSGCTSQAAVYFSKLKTVPSIDKRVKLHKFMDADFVLRKVLSGESESLHLSPELNDIVNGTTQLVWLTTSRGSNNFKQLYNERLAEGVNNNIKSCHDAMMAYAHIEAVKQNIDLSSMIEQKKYERNLYECLDYIKLGEAVSQGLLDGIKDTTFTRCSDIDATNEFDRWCKIKVNNASKLKKFLSTHPIHVKWVGLNKGNDYYMEHDNDTEYILCPSDTSNFIIAYFGRWGEQVCLELNLNPFSGIHSAELLTSNKDKPVTAEFHFCNEKDEKAIREILNSGYNK